MTYKQPTDVRVELVKKSRGGEGGGVKNPQQTVIFLHDDTAFGSTWCKA